MSLKLSANYFRNSPIAGWSGSAWVEGIGKGSFHVNQTEDKFRVLLVTPDMVLLPTYSVISVADHSQVYLVGQESAATSTSIYSRAVTLRRAPVLFSVVEYTTQTAASGVLINSSRTINGALHGDIEVPSFTNSKEAGGVKAVEVDIMLPIDAPVTASSELEYEGKLYKIQGVGTDKGLLRCTCTVMTAP